MKRLKHTLCALAALICSIGMADEPGKLLLRKWVGHQQSTLDYFLSDNAAYPNGPSISAYVTELNFKQYEGDRYVRELVGWVTVPTTGSYTFIASGDDVVRVWLSTDATEANAVQICTVPSATNYQQTNAHASQTSSAISLTAGQKYYFKCLHYEGLATNGNDHLSVYIEGPGLARQLLGGTLVSAPSDSSLVSIPAGTTGQLQFNSAGSFGADSNLFWDNTTKRLSIGTTASPNGHRLTVGAGTGQEGITIYSGPSSEGQLNFSDGTTGSAPYVGKLLYNHTDNRMSFVVNAAERMRIDAAGNVGIGTTGPSGRLTIQQNGSGLQELLWLENRQTEAAGVGSHLRFAGKSGVWQGGVAAAWEGSASTEAYLAFFTRGSGSTAERMRIDSAGNVKLSGSASPQLTVGQTALNGLPILRLQNQNGQACISKNSTEGGGILTGSLASAMVLAVDGNNAIQFGTNHTPRMTIDGSGNVGIGTSGPAWKLQVVGTNERMGITDGTNNLIFGQWDGSTNRVESSGRSLSFVQYGADKVITFATNASERLHIDAAGNVGIGSSLVNILGNRRLAVGSTTSGMAGSVSVFSNASQNGYLAFADGTTGDQNYRGLIQYNHSADSMDFYTAGQLRVHVNSTGNVGIGTTTPLSSSKSTATPRSSAIWKLPARSPQRLAAAEQP